MPLETSTYLCKHVSLPHLPYSIPCFCRVQICSVKYSAVPVLPASQQIIPVAGSKWRLQEDLSSLSAEEALIIFLLSVSWAALCDAGLTPDLPRGQHQVEATGGLVLHGRRTGLNSIPTFCIRSSAVWCWPQARSSPWSASSWGCRRTCPLKSRTGLDHIPIFCIRSGAVWCWPHGRSSPWSASSVSKKLRPSLEKNGRRNVRKLERQFSARYTES